MGHDRIATARDVAHAVAKPAAAQQCGSRPRGPRAGSRRPRIDEPRAPDRRLDDHDRRAALAQARIFVERPERIEPAFAVGAPEETLARPQPGEELLRQRDALSADAVGRARRRVQHAMTVRPECLPRRTKADRQPLREQPRREDYG